MAKSNADFMFENFCFNFPLYRDEVESYRDYSDFELLVRLKSGKELIYEDIQCSVDFMNNLSGEDAWRRRFGMKLRHLMYKSGLYQGDLAKMCGISMRSLSLYINGKSVPSLYNAEKIAKALGCTTEELLRFPKE